MRIFLKSTRKFVSGCIWKSFELSHYKDAQKQMCGTQDIFWGIHTDVQVLCTLQTLGQSCVGTGNEWVRLTDSIKTATKSLLLLPLRYLVFQTMITVDGYFSYLYFQEVLTFKKINHILVDATYVHPIAPLSLRWVPWFQLLANQPVFWIGSDYNKNKTLKCSLSNAWIPFKANQ